MAEEESSDEESVDSVWSADEEFAWELRDDTRFDSPDIVAQGNDATAGAGSGNTKVYLLPENFRPIRDLRGRF